MLDEALAILSGLIENGSTDGGVPAAGQNGSERPQKDQQRGARSKQHLTDNFVCAQCNIGFAEKIRFQRHMRVKHGVGKELDKYLLYCVNCTYCFMEEDAYACHVVKLHSDPEPQFFCRRCDRVFFSAVKFKSHGCPKFEVTLLDYQTRYAKYKAKKEATEKEKKLLKHRVALQTKARKFVNSLKATEEARKLIRSRTGKLGSYDESGKYEPPLHSPRMVKSEIQLGKVVFKDSSKGIDYSFTPNGMELEVPATESEPSRKRERLPVAEFFCQPPKRDKIDPEALASSQTSFFKDSSLGRRSRNTADPRSPDVRMVSSHETDRIAPPLLLFDSDSPLSECPVCSRKFASEQYLNAHMTRERHWYPPARPPAKKFRAFHWRVDEPLEFAVPKPQVHDSKDSPSSLKSETSNKRFEDEDDRQKKISELLESIFDDDDMGGAIEADLKPSPNDLSRSVAGSDLVTECASDLVSTNLPDLDIKVEVTSPTPLSAANEAAEAPDQTVSVKREAVSPLPLPPRPEPKVEPVSPDDKEAMPNEIQPSEPEKHSMSDEAEIPITTPLKVEPDTSQKPKLEPGEPSGTSSREITHGITQEKLPPASCSTPKKIVILSKSGKLITQAPLKIVVVKRRSHVN